MQEDNMTTFLTKSGSVNMDHPYFLGVMFRLVANVANSTRKVRQVRLGLIWWHCGITFIF